MFCGEILAEGLQALLRSTLEKHNLTFSFFNSHLEPTPDLHLAQRGQPTLPTQVTQDTGTRGSL